MVGVTWDSPNPSFDLFGCLFWGMVILFVCVCFFPKWWDNFLEFLLNWWNLCIVQPNILTNACTLCPKFGQWFHYQQNMELVDVELFCEHGSMANFWGNQIIQPCFKLASCCIPILLVGFCPMSYWLVIIGSPNWTNWMKTQKRLAICGSMANPRCVFSMFFGSYSYFCCW